MLCVVVLLNRNQEKEQCNYAICNEDGTIFLPDSVEGYKYYMFKDFDKYLESMGATTGVENNGRGLIGSMVGIYDFFFNPNNGDLEEQLDHVQEQLDVIEAVIEEIVVTVEEESIRTQYVSSQRVILESLRCYNAYANMTHPEAASYWYKEFLKWGSFVRESVNFLMDGMLGTGFIASDILESMVIISKVIVYINIYYKYWRLMTQQCVSFAAYWLTLKNVLQNNPVEFKKRTDVFFGLLNSGLYVHGAYCANNNQSQRVK